MTRISDETPIVIYPILAKKLKSEAKAAIIYQLQQWLEDPDCYQVIDGIKWMFCPIKTEDENEITWRNQFPNWGEAKLRRALKELAEEGFIKREKLAASTYCHGYYYSLCMDKVQPLFEKAEV